MIIETLTVNEIQRIMHNVKEGFERANVQKSFLSYSESDGKAVLEYDGSLRAFYHLHTRNNRVFELPDTDVYFILKNIKDGKYKLTNVMQVIKN